MSVIKFIFLFSVIVFCDGDSNIDNKSLLEHVRLGLDAITEESLALQERTMWHAYKFDSGIGNREELVIKSINSDNEFNIGQQVTEWQSINVRNKSYAVGLMSTGFTVLTAHLNEEKSGFTTTARIIDLGEVPLAFTLFKSWNTARNDYDIIVIAGLGGNDFDMHWYRITNDNNLDKIWWWHLHKKVTHLKIFELENQQKLLIINEEKDDSKSITADIYNFILDKDVSDFWLFQTITLDCSATSSGTNNFGPYFYLSVPQQLTDSVRIFQYRENRFVLYKNIISKNVDYITSFSIGYRSFLAIGGYNFAIYRFTKTGLQKEEVIDANLAEVKCLLVVPVETYRDEVMLLAQHQLDHGTHHSVSVEMIVYAKGMFVAHEEMPCTAYGQFSHGVTCIADEELDTGIYGSAVLSFSEVLGIVVPRLEAPSGLFVIDWQLVEMRDPMVEKVDRITKSIIHVQKMLTDQETIVSDIENDLSKTINIHSDNVITAPWKIHTLLAPKATIGNLKQSNRMADDSKPDALTELEENLKLIADEMNSVEDKLLSIRSLRVAEENTFENLTIHGQLEVKGTANIDNMHILKINDDDFHELIDDCARRDQRNIITGTKIFSNASVDNVTFAMLNNISADKVVYKSGDDIHIKGDLIFKKPLRVKKDVTLSKGGAVNGIKLQEELVYMNSDITYPNVHLESIEVENINNLNSLNEADMTMFSEESENFLMSSSEDSGLKIKLQSLYLPQANITAKNVNGENFVSFLKSLCLRNLKYNFPGTTTIFGNVHVKGSAEIDTLNELKYPEEYLVKKETGFTRITGKKVFEGNVSAAEVVVNGLVDGINPNHVITCSLNQTIPGTFTFSNLEVTESMNVDGAIQGPNLDNFIPNPTLEEANILSANIIFDKLEVNGDVVISDNLHNENLKTILEDVVYTDEIKAVINAEKTFSGSVNIKNLHIASNFINDINIDNILTVDTEQKLSASTIDGPVTIENLELGGFFNSENVTKLFEEVVKLDEDQEILANIKFENFDGIPDIIASELHIGKVNNMDSSDFILTTGDRVLSEEVLFAGIKSDNLLLLSDLNQEIDYFDINYYDQYRLSLTRDQTISAKYQINKGVVDDIDIKKVNGFDINLLMEFMNISNVLEGRLLNGEFEIEELHVNGSINIDILNNHNMKILFENVFWMNKRNNITRDFIFENPIYFKNLEVNTLNDYNFKSFIADIVLKNETDIKFEGRKTFVNGLEIKLNLITDYISANKVDDLLISTGQQNILGHVIIHGDVWVETEIDVRDFINNVSINYLQSTVRLEDGKYIISGDVSFDENVKINNLYVNGLLNGVKPEHYFESIIGIHDDTVINGTVVFKNKVLIDKNLGIANTIDGVNLDTFVKDVVLISSDEYIAGLVTFTQDVNITEFMELETDLDTRYLCGCDLEKWKEETVYMESYMPGNFTFENVTVLSNIYVDYINDIDMYKLVPLGTDQVIDETMEFNFMTVDNDIKVGNLVNGYILAEEYANSVLKNTDEIIESEIVFQAPVAVRKHLKTTGLINGKDLKRMVTTDTDQNLTASYAFTGKVTIDSDVYVSGKVNDINITDWARRLVTTYGDDEQNITDVWSVRGNVTFQSHVIGDGLVGGWDIGSMADRATYRLEQKYALQEEFKENYKSACSAVQDFFTDAKSQIFLFKHLELYQEFSYDEDVECVHEYKFEDNHYLIVSWKSSCYSKIYVWTSNYFKFICDTETGTVEQFITVLDTNEIYLVAKNYDANKCSYSGVNMWVFNQEILIHVNNLEDAYELHNSQIPRTFYTLNTGFVTEYRLLHEDKNMSVYPYRKWNIPEGNYTFNSHGQKFGFSLRSKKDILKLSRKTSKSIEISDDMSTVPGDIVVLPNNHMQFMNEGEVLIMDVGFPGSYQRLTAVATHEETRVRGKTDSIKIYEDLPAGILFTKIMTYKPSSLTALSFGGNGETILAFLENRKSLELYEYKGIEGFRHRSSIKIQASRMTSISLPLEPYLSKRSFLFVVHKNRVSIVHAVMSGDRPEKNLYCDI